MASDQRLMLKLVVFAKDVDRRIARALTGIEMLKFSDGVFDYRTHHSAMRLVGARAPKRSNRCMGKTDRIKFKAELTQSSTGSGWHFLLIEKPIVDRFAFPDKFKRVICSINGSAGFQCALLPWGQMFYIIVNKKKRDAMGIVSGDIVDVELVRDESKYGLPMPEEFREVLDQDPDGDRLFHALTAGKQRSVLYHVGNVRDIDKRIHVALIFIDHLKNNGGNIVNKTLTEELKRPIY